MGQWLSMICESFGMQEYYEETPFFKNINKYNPYFSVVQAAAEWEVIDQKDSLDVNEALTWKKALLTLMNVGRFVDLESTEDEKIKAAIAKFDSSIRTYWMDRTIPTEKAVTYLNQAQHDWAGMTFDKNVEEIEYKQEVKNLSEALDKTDFVIEEKDNTVIISNEQFDDIKPGDIYILPAEQ